VTPGSLQSGIRDGGEGLEALLRAAGVWGANCYLVKPLGFKSFQAIVRAIEEFWFDTARLPQDLETQEQRAEEGPRQVIP